MEQNKNKLETIDRFVDAPINETERQLYFIEKAKEYVKIESDKLGRPLTFHVTTFGCA